MCLARNADTLQRLNDAERKLKKQKEDSYINMDLCNEEKDKGNAFFKEHKSVHILRVKTNSAQTLACMYIS